MLIYIINATQIATDDDSFHLNFVWENVKDKPILFLLNKVDRWNPEKETIHTEIPHVKDYLKNHGFDMPLLLPISAQAAETVQKFHKGEMGRSDKHELYNLIDKFEKLNLSEYYQKVLSKVQVKDFATEEDNLLKTCGIRYVEKTILEFYKGEM